MICPSCRHFASQELGEPECDLDVEAGLVTGSCRIVVVSSCCGDELKESTFDVEIDLAEDFEKAIRKAKQLSAADSVELEEWQFEITSQETENTERWQATKTLTKRDGTRIEKPIPARYQRHFYGAEVKVTVTATDEYGTAVSVDGQWQDEIQASGLDELG